MYSIGSGSLTLPVALVEVPWKGAFTLAEAGRAELELLGFVLSVTQCTQGVSADHTSVSDTAHRASFPLIMLGTST